MSDKVLMYKSPSTGMSFAFKPMVTLKGFELIENKKSERLHELMREIKNECFQLKINFKAEIYEYELPNWDK